MINKFTKQDSLMQLFKQTKLTVIVGANKFLKPFADYLALRYDVKQTPILFSEDAFAVKELSGDERKAEAPILYVIDSVCTAERRNLIVDEIAILHQASQNSNAPHVIFAPCETHSQWRSLYFHLPESIKDTCQLLLLNLRNDARLDLTIEQGKHAGEYIQFYFDAVSGQFTEILL